MRVITPLALGFMLFMPLASAQITPETISVETMPEPGANRVFIDTDTLPENFRQLTTKEVGEARENPLADPLKYREQFWKTYDN